MAASLILVAAPLILASAPPPEPPSDTVRDQHRYYTLTVSQNNENKSFDQNFIDMESAEVKSGKNKNVISALSCCYIVYAPQPKPSHCFHFHSQLMLSSWFLPVVKTDKKIKTSAGYNIEYFKAVLFMYISKPIFPI